jgi:hypothetical protein
MVPAVVPVKVPVVAVAKTMEARIVPDPEASTKRPVPPVTVKEAVSWRTFGLEVGQKTSLTERKTLSPFAALYVSTSIAVKPPHVDGPVIVLVPVSVVNPRC